MDKCDQHDFGNLNVKVEEPQVARVGLPTAQDFYEAEKRARLNLYGAVSGFVAEPSYANGDVLTDRAVKYRDAWMHGRRRVMD